MFCRGCAPVPAPNLEDRRNFFNVTSVINLWGSPKCAVLRYFRLGCMSQFSPSPKTGRYLRAKINLACQCSNPHPVRKLGAIIICDLKLNLFLFQSSPSPKTGRYLITALEYAVSNNVPILTQSENWALSLRRSLCK